jgi:ketol-acid reductoisomerase
MEKLLSDIQDGTFAREMMSEEAAGRPNFTKLREQDANHQIEVVGRQLRAMMPWIGEKAAVKPGA